MAFCKFSSEYVSKTYTIVDNIFFTRYLPTTPPKVATVYLYGLYLCNNNAQDLSGNSISSFANALGYTEDEILDAFRYWEEQGLVRIVNADPLEVQYLPIRGVHLSNKKYNKDKYIEFNTQAQEILSGRQITPNEYEGKNITVQAIPLQTTGSINPPSQSAVETLSHENKLFYRIPETAYVKVSLGEDVLLEKRETIAQFGVFMLAPLGKTKLGLDPNTGQIISMGME